MFSRRLIALGASALVFGWSVASNAAQPFAIEDIDFTSDCNANPALDRVLQLLLGRSSLFEAAWTVDQPLLDALAGEMSYTLHLDRATDWHGLHLVEIRALYGIERGPSNTTLAFSDSAERVREVWNARGWNLPPVGQTRVIEDEDITVAIGVGQDGDRATVTCFTD